MVDTKQPAPTGQGNVRVPYDPTQPAYTPGNPGANIQFGSPPPQNTIPGTPLYDLYRIHELMVEYGYGNGDWEMVGQPVQVITEKANPLYDSSNPGDPNNPPSVQTATQTWIINIRNAKTHEVKRIEMSKLFPKDGGGTTQTDPGNGSSYSWSPTQITDQQAADKVGHSNPMTIGSTIYGTNNQTGAFEPVPGAPAVPKGWANPHVVTESNGNIVWYGNDPADEQLKPIPNMPVITPAMQAWGDPQQVDDGQGHMVWYGIDPADKQRKPIPGMPTTAKQTGPGSINQGGTIYVLKPDGTYGPAPGVPDPNPPVGTPRVKLGDDGYLYQEKYQGGGQWQFDPTFKSVPYTEAAKAAAAKTAGTTTHQAGERGEKLLSDGKVYTVTYKGGGDDNFEVDTSIAARPMAGTVTPSTIATSTDQPKIVQRMPDGSVQTVDNPNYQPTDPALRVQQLTNQASAKLQELQGKIGANYTPEQAQADFDQWWSSNIEPAKQQLTYDQQQKQLEYQLKVSAEQRAQGAQEAQNYSTAIQAGTAAVDAAKAATANAVGPNFGDVIGQLVQGWQHPGAPGPSAADISRAVTYPTPNYAQISQQATAAALAHISPTAAAIAGQQLPQFQAMDFSQMLNRNSPQYQFHVNPVASAAPNTNPVVAAPQPIVAPPGAVPGQNYGAATAYTGGVLPWNAQPYAYSGSF